jgi:hypothetical protein
MIIRYRLRNGVAHSVDTWGMLQDVDLSFAELSGDVELYEPRKGRLVVFSSNWVERLRIEKTATQIVIDLKIDAPIPDYPPAARATPWRIEISCAAAKPDWAVAALIPWLIDVGGDDRCKGGCDEWLKRSNLSAPRLRNAFPFDRLGLSSAPVPGFGSLRVGLFVNESAGRAMLHVVCIPAEEDGQDVRIPLAIAHFTDTDLQVRKSRLRTALVAHLDAGFTGSDGIGSPWFSVFQWPIDRETAPDRFFERIWNLTTNTTARGLRGVHAGRPWWPVPTVSKVDWKNKVEWQRLIFSVPTDTTNPTGLRRLEYGREQGSGADAGIDIAFHWYADETHPTHSTPGDPGRRALQLTGKLKVTEEPAADPKTPAAALAAARMVDEVLDRHTAAILSCAITVEKYAATDSAWLNFGSIDLRPRPLGDKETITLQCDLTGTWNSAVCDVYSQTRLDHMPCLFRMSNAGDPQAATIVAQFDVLNQLEDDLQRPALPVVESYTQDSAGALEGSLHLRVHAQPARDALIQLRLRRNRFITLKGHALYLQTRPFNFARLWPADFDEEAGLDFSYWRSDDPEGPQWRIPDATITFDLPPQTVAEEMERGTRFWPIDTSSGKPAPYIDPQHPLRYRFSPPTRVTVRPGRVERRYNRNTNNLSDILDGARVEAFRTELLYPLALKFEADGNGQPAIEIAESGNFLGRPAPNLPVPQRQPPGGASQTTREAVIEAARALAEDIFPDDLAAWFTTTVIPTPDLAQFQQRYDRLRWLHSANRAQFVARIAQFHVFDPSLPQRQLALSTGLTAQLRRPDPQQSPAPVGSMPPLLNPLPRGVDVDEKVRNSDGDGKALKAFLGPNAAWGDPVADGALRTGALHTIEFPSELVAVLRDPAAVTAFIETLSFSTLGASGTSSVSFDEGRTTFSVEIADGQIWRIRKIRIGRAALFWNKAKHVIVYERSVVPSLQFESQQPNEQTYGWPILRKSEEYIEPIEMCRVFNDEPDADTNATGFVNACEFTTRRIYVDSAWGTDLGHGYEIPLWNPADTSGFYPKPQAALSARAGSGELSRHWQEHPEEIYFYTNTQKGTGADSNTWDAFLGVDQTDEGPARLPNATNEGLPAGEVLDATRLRSARPAALRRKRFDLVVRSDGPVNLQHDRGDTEMLAAGLDVVSLARTSAISAVKPVKGTALDKALKNVGVMAEHAGRVDSLRDEVATFLRELPELFVKYQLAGCATLGKQMRLHADALFQRMDNAASAAFSGIPDFTLPEQVAALAADKAALISRLRAEMFDWTLPSMAAFRVLAAEFRRQIVLARKYTRAELNNAKKHVGDQLRASFALFDQVIGSAQNKLRDALLQPTLSAQTHIDQVAVAVTTFATQVDDWLTSTGPTFRSKAKALRDEANQLKTRIAALTIPHLAAPLKGAVSTLTAIAQVAQEGIEIVDADIPVFKTRLATTLNVVVANLVRLKDALKSIAKTVTQQALDSAFDTVRKTLHDIENCLRAEVWQDAAKADVAIDTLLTLTGSAVDDASALLEGIFQQWRDRLGAMTDTLARTIGTQLHELSLPVADLCNRLRQTMQLIAKTVSTEIARQRQVVSATIDKLQTACAQGQQALDELKKTIAAELHTLAQTVETQVTGLVTSLFDDATRQRMAGWKTQLASHQDTVGKGLKLVKAIGSLPELPQLTFNADRVEYVFDDVKRQIETSPFAARIREIDSGLKELGIAIPVRELFNQLVPDDLKVDFNKVFRDLGGIDFRKLFSSFKLPGLDKEQIKITHGVDKPTRTAWLKAVVSTSYPGPEELFAKGPLVVRTAAMSLQAQSDVRMGLDGQRSTQTTGLLRADWTLDFKGAKLVAFRNVTVKLDGGKFSFNIAPENIELHPALKFVSDIAKKIGERIPPCIELVRDSRGVVAGARANLSTIIRNPPSLGAVKIGPLMLIGGLALTLEEGCKFAVSAHLSVGTKTAPIFVQINFLGGGVWLETEARFIDGKISYLGNVGLALGSTESFNIGGVARGSYSLLLFAYASFRSGAGGSLRAGLSVQGCARILGIVNAYVMLLLEVTHGEGKSSGKGLLDVEVEIGRWYSIKVHKQVERTL